MGILINITVTSFSKLIVRNTISGRKTLWIICLFISTTTLLTYCLQDKSANKVIIQNSRGQHYAGSASCRQCHQAICDSFNSTAHHLTSQMANKNNISGSFEDFHNSFAFDEHKKVMMLEYGDSLYQVAWDDGKKERAEPFDIVIGSGKKGQSYLFWKGRELYQLPVSYFTAIHAWAASPGYAKGKISFDRQIEARCLECHTTFAKELPGYEYPKEQIVYGVDCERCHGPAAEHVAWHLQNPKETKAKFIVNTASLGRRQALDACALCHSGVMASYSPAFSFQPGDTLSKYFILNSAHIDSSSLDVHANQYGLLTASKCFRLSNMSCSTCHDPHKKESGNLVTYAQKCMSCHNQQNHDTCKLQFPAGFSMVNNCVNCHMPVKASKNLTMFIQSSSTPAPEYVRSHLIAVYPNESKQILSTNK